MAIHQFFGALATGVRTGFINGHADFGAIRYCIEYLHTPIHLLVVWVSIDSFTVRFKVLCGREVLISILTTVLFKSHLALGKVVAALLLLRRVVVHQTIFALLLGDHRGKEGFPGGLVFFVRLLLLTFKI